MAETIPDLTDAQIEQLLSAAEVSLANKTSADKTVAVKDKQQSRAVTGTGTAPDAQVKPSKAGNDAAIKPAEELTLRIPQLRVKNKKVNDLPTTLSPSNMMKTISQISNDAGGTSVMAANPAPQ